MEHGGGRGGNTKIVDVSTTKDTHAKTKVGKAKGQYGPGCSISGDK